MIFYIIIKGKQAAILNEKHAPFRIDLYLTGRNIYVLVVMKATKM